MLNLWTQWGSLLIYFEMPSWVKDFNASIVEEETDAEDVKALKVRFVLYFTIHVAREHAPSHLTCAIINNDTCI
jgi:hypothetical protein